MDGCRDHARDTAPSVVASPPRVVALVMTTLYRWASETGANGMPHVEECEYLGYAKVREHPAYPGAWLMVKEDDDGARLPME